MAREKLMTAALAVIAAYDQGEWEGPEQPLDDAIARLRECAHRRCETCGHLGNRGQETAPTCDRVPHSPPRALDDTCAQWKERE